MFWNLLFGRRLSDEEYIVQFRSVFEDYASGTTHLTGSGAAHEFDRRVLYRLKRFRPANPTWDPLHTAFRRLVGHRSRLAREIARMAERGGGGLGDFIGLSGLTSVDRELSDQLNREASRLSWEDRVKLFGRPAIKTKATPPVGFRRESRARFFCDYPAGTPEGDALLAKLIKAGHGVSEDILNMKESVLIEGPRQIVARLVRAFDELSRDLNSYVRYVDLQSGTALKGLGKQRLSAEQLAPFQAIAHRLAELSAAAA